MNVTELRQAIGRACQVRDAAIAKAAREAPDYAAYDAAAGEAMRQYRRIVSRTYRRLAP